MQKIGTQMLIIAKTINYECHIHCMNFIGCKCILNKIQHGLSDLNYSYHFIISFCMTIKLRLIVIQYIHESTYFLSHSYAKTSLVIQII